VLADGKAPRVDRRRNSRQRGRQGRGAEALARARRIECRGVPVADRRLGPETARQRALLEIGEQALDDFSRSRVGHDPQHVLGKQQRIKLAHVELREIEVDQRNRDRAFAVGEMQIDERRRFPAARDRLDPRDGETVGSDQLAQQFGSPRPWLQSGEDAMRSHAVGTADSSARTAATPSTDGSSSRSARSKPATRTLFCPASRQ
jgi:hypothetical protein